MFKISYFLIAVLISTTLWAQKMPMPYPTRKTAATTSTAICGTDILLGNLRKNFAFREKEAAINSQIRNAQNDSRVMATSYTLPVVFHIINSNPSAITNAMIAAALKDLNNAFSKKGAYAASKGADTKIKFCLSKKDPDGGITTGITRTQHFFGQNHNTLIEEDRLKNLIQWDPTRYINIWVIENITTEISAQFRCGQWVRISEGGYATLPPNGGALDGIVVTGFGALLAHEMGHYLGLYHTFQGGCNNDDCETDGDMVCDTPPDNAIGNSPSCSSPDNSCNTDTLSKHSNGFFKKDVPDLIADFMDYGNDACHNEFTEGQAARMRATIATQRSGLLQNECNKPCNDNIVAGFNRDNPYPVTGDNINFTNTSTGAANYQWLIDSVVVATTANLSHSFTAAGKYKVSLRAYNNASCAAIYTDYVTVNCGVIARFYTDKRAIASKDPVYLDSIYFTNNSQNATSYKWLMSNDQGMAEKVVSTAKDLNYIFKTPGNYTVRLVAARSGCRDTTETFTIPVTDPTANATVYINSVSCYQQTKVRVKFFVCNDGYAPIPANTPVSFYDADPNTAGAHKIGDTYLLPEDIPGRCCGPYQTVIIDVNKTGFNQVYVVVNDDGSTIPLKLPNTNLPEIDYKNNINFASNFTFKISASPAQATLEPGDTLQITALPSPDDAIAYSWQPPYNFLCDNCKTTQLIADTTTVKMLVAQSEYGCVDTAYIPIDVPPADDYTIHLDNLQCAANNTMHLDFTLFNSFKRGVLSKGLSVSFYDNDPTTGTATLLSPVYFLSDTVKAKQSSFSTTINANITGTLYAVVNDSGTTAPLKLPNTEMLEKDYSNNVTSLAYVPETVQLQPADTIVFKHESFPVVINTTVYNPASTQWFDGSGYTLSCNSCASPMVNVTDSCVVTMQTANQYGCLIPGKANVKIFPPDMTIQILGTNCYSNNNTLVNFKICMSNNYDSVFANIPVSFYDSLPSPGRLLRSVYYTPNAMPGNCNTYTQVITSPTTKSLVAVVNDKGDNATIPSKAFDETDATNNTAQFTITPFNVIINPADTSIPRLTPVTLTPVVTGGNPGSYTWRQTTSLSCTNCLITTATPPYTTTYQLVVQNEFSCKDTAYALVKTYTGGLVNMPSAFSPNHDGLNDIFYVLAGSTVNQVKDFVIYNRWGQEMFHVHNVLPNNPTFGWNGYYKGSLVAPGAYVYYVQVALTDGTTAMFKGTVVIVQ